MALIDERRRTSFDARAEAYDAARPAYPNALLARVLERSGARRVLEIGAGTGQATKGLARLGCRVLALEPGPRLAAILRKNVASFPAVAVEEATFEAFACEDCSFDLVLAASSIHWVDPGARYAKAARVATHLACLLNQKAPIDPAVRAAFDDAYTRWTGGGDGNERSRREVELARRDVAAEIDASGLYGPVEIVEVPWEAAYSARAYVDLLDTYSDNAVLDERARRGLFADIAAAIDAHGGILRVPYVSLAFLATAR